MFGNTNNRAICIIGVVIIEHSSFPNQTCYRILTAD